MVLLTRTGESWSSRDRELWLRDALLPLLLLLDFLRLAETGSVSLARAEIDQSYALVVMDHLLVCHSYVILLCFCAWDILAVEWEAGCQEVGCQSVLRQVGPVDQVDQVDQVDRVDQVDQVGQVGQGGRQEPVPHGCNSSLVSHTWWLNLHMHDKDEKHGLAIILCLWWGDNDQETVKWLIKSQNN